MIFNACGHENSQSKVFYIAYPKNRLITVHKHALHLLVANPLGGANAIAEGCFAFPFPGHNGIDISFANCYGEPVYACAPGTVRYIQDGWTPAHGVSNMWSFGNCVVVDHTDGWQSVYAHLSRLAVAYPPGAACGVYWQHWHLYWPTPDLALYYHGSPSEDGMNYAEMAWPQI